LCIAKRSVETLLLGRLHINAQRSDGLSVLSLANVGGRSAVVKVSLGNGAQIETIDNNDRSPLICAACKGHTDIVCELLSAGADINTVDNTSSSALPFTISIYNGHNEVLKVLLDNGAQIET